MDSCGALRHNSVPVELQSSSLCAIAATCMKESKSSAGAFPYWNCPSSLFTSNYLAVFAFCSQGMPIHFEMRVPIRIFGSSYMSAGFLRAGEKKKAAVFSRGLRFIQYLLFVPTENDLSESVRPFGRSRQSLSNLSLANRQARESRPSRGDHSPHTIAG
jgi:hypothetical protein